MYKLKLKKVKSYFGAVRATVKQPFVEVETEAEAQALVKTGYFDQIEVTEETAGDEENGEDEGGEVDYDALSKMSKAELTKYAEDNAISIDGCSTKAEILEAISVFYGGSSTMIDLQQ